MQWPGVDHLVHPSPLYQAATEGILLFTIVWIFSWRPRPRYAVSGVFALGYGCFRFSTEFFRRLTLLLRQDNARSPRGLKLG